MQESDRPVFIGLMEALCATFRAEPSEALFEGYWMALDDLPIDHVRNGVAEAMRSSAHLPRPNPAGLQACMSSRLQPRL